MTERFRPTRAGVINVWDYVDEEFAFADGRLALRGHNGSGKTKALEVLFPFILDGVADSRRLDPFSGENRTMKSNLLYRGQDSEYGYAWMEFALHREAGRDDDKAETVTLIIGMRAHRNRDGVKMSFYVTSARMGVDFGLLSADSRPLTERQLRAVLEPGAFCKSATDYRDAIDARLFGLGRQRYAQLLDLLLALRRPLLAKDLDPAKVSDTLTAGLSPVDDDLVQQGARDFENLAAVQKLFDDLTAANAAVAEFTAGYAAYVRVHVRHALERITARSGVAAGQAQAITAAAAERSRALAAERDAESRRDAARAQGEQLAGRLEGLRNSEEYKAQGRIEDKRREVARRAQEAATAAGRRAGGRQAITQAQAAAGRLERRVPDARASASRHAAELAEAADRSGIADDGLGPVDPGDELLTSARARAATRREDVREIRRLLEEIRTARDRRESAEAGLSRSEAALEAQEAASEQAATALQQAREQASAAMTGWISRWAPAPGAPSAAPPPDGLPGHVISGEEARELASALEEIAEPGATGLPEVFAALTAQRQAAVITAAANYGTQLAGHRAELAGLRAERDAIAAEKDDAPPPSDLRPASREGRPGAPLWQLVRFADDIGEDRAAAIEGALYGAGLLTAWLHPDPALTWQALAAAEADGYLIPAAPVTGASLADVLVPEQQGHVPADVITAVLRSVTLAAALDGAAAGSAAAGGVQVSQAAQFSYGPHAGARPKARPEFIGATNRAARRAARLAAHDQLIAAAEHLEQQLAGRLAAATALRGDFTRASRELPATAPIAQAAQAASRQSVLLARCRDDVTAASKAVDAAIAEADAKLRQLRQAATERRMPAQAEQVDAIARAAADFEDAAKALHADRAAVAQAEDDLQERTEEIEQARLELARQEAAFGESERQRQALEEEFRALEEALSAGVQQVLEQVRDAEEGIKAAQLRYREHDVVARDEHDKATTAGAALAAARQLLAQAVAALHEQARGFGEHARPDLRSLLAVAGAPHWPDPAQWPDPAAASDELAARLEAGAAAGLGPQQAATAVSGVLPPAVPEILAAYAAAARGGRQVTDITLKNSSDAMSTGLKDFERALAACDEDYRVDWEPGGALVFVSVIDEEGRKPVAEFAARISGRAAEQGILLADRERTVLEDELLSGLARQIHARVLAARDLTREMDADTRSKPMSSGITVGIRWAQSDAITDWQRAAARLLERDAPGPERLGELRGVLREMIREYRAAHPRATYREALASALDYLSWHAFELAQKNPGEPEFRLTRAKHSVMSGGEKSASIHLPLFAAANALYSSAKEHAPRMIALDEAFAGIDERYKPDLYGLAVKFDLDLFMTGHDLWVTYDTVPMIAHYDMYHEVITRTVSSLLVLWDGTALIDSSAGFADNEELVTQLLGFRPTRHVPVGAAATLYAAGELAEPAEDDDDDEPL